MPRRAGAVLTAEAQWLFPIPGPALFRQEARGNIPVCGKRALCEAGALRNGVPWESSSSRKRPLPCSQHPWPARAPSALAASFASAAGGRRSLPGRATAQLVKKPRFFEKIRLQLRYIQREKPLAGLSRPAVSTKRSLAFSARKTSRLPKQDPGSNRLFAQKARFVWPWAIIPPCGERRQA